MTEEQPFVKQPNKPQMKLGMVIASASFVTTVLTVSAGFGFGYASLKNATAAHATRLTTLDYRSREMKGRLNSLEVSMEVLKKQDEFFKELLKEMSMDIQYIREKLDTRGNRPGD